MSKILNAMIYDKPAERVITKSKARENLNNEENSIVENDFLI